MAAAEQAEIETKQQLQAARSQKGISNSALSAAVAVHAAASQALQEARQSLHLTQVHVAKCAVALREATEARDSARALLARARDVDDKVAGSLATDKSQIEYNLWHGINRIRLPGPCLVARAPLRQQPAAAAAAAPQLGQAPGDEWGGVSQAVTGVMLPSEEELNAYAATMPHASYALLPAGTRSRAVGLGRGLGLGLDARALGDREREWQAKNRIVAFKLVPVPPFTTGRVFRGRDRGQNLDTAAMGAINTPAADIIGDSDSDSDDRSATRDRGSSRRESAATATAAATQALSRARAKAGAGPMDHLAAAHARASSKAAPSAAAAAAASAAAAAAAAAAADPVGGACEPDAVAAANATARARSHSHSYMHPAAAAPAAAAAAVAPAAAAGGGGSLGGLPTVDPSRISLDRLRAQVVAQPRSGGAGSLNVNVNTATTPPIGISATARSPSAAGGNFLASSAVAGGAGQGADYSSSPSPSPSPTNTSPATTSLASANLPPGLVQGLGGGVFARGAGLKTAPRDPQGNYVDDRGERREDMRQRRIESAAAEAAKAAAPGLRASPSASVESGDDENTADEEECTETESDDHSDDNGADDRAM